MSSAMSDKERMLLAISNALARPDYKDIPDAERLGAWVDWRDEALKPGALVSCMTSVVGGVHPYCIGWVTEVIGPAECNIRELGSDRICRVSNERFYVIRGVNPYELLEGAQYGLYQRVLRAFRIGGEWAYRFGGLRFDADGAAYVTIREVFGGLNGRSVPFEVRLAPWKRVSAKRLLEQLRVGGYGTREFERLSGEPNKVHLVIEP